jgi:hypothetical protein
MENTIQIGDVVIVHTDNKKRVLWPLAKVIELYRSEDGLVRSARILTKTGTTNRPITKLYPLEMANEEVRSREVDSRISTTPPIEQRPKRDAAIAAQERIKMYTDN